MLSTKPAPTGSATSEYDRNGAAIVDHCRTIAASPCSVLPAGASAHERRRDASSLRRVASSASGAELSYFAVEQAGSSKVGAPISASNSHDGSAVPPSWCRSTIRRHDRGVQGRQHRRDVSSASPRIAPRLRFRAGDDRPADDFLVPASSTIKTIAEIDRAGVRIVVREERPGEHLEKIIKNATMLRSRRDQKLATDLIASGQAMRSASRPDAANAQPALPGSRILPGSYYDVRSPSAIRRARRNGGRIRQGFVADMKPRLRAEGDRAHGQESRRRRDRAVGMTNVAGATATTSDAQARRPVLHRRGDLDPDQFRCNVRKPSYERLAGPRRPTNASPTIGRNRS